MNSKAQGNIGLGQAIAYFTSEGYSVSIPLTESQRYDIIVDDGETLYRVEVKTSSFKRASYEVQLATAGGNQSWNGKPKPLSERDCDLLFVYTLGGDRYVFPIEAVKGKAKLNLSPDKDQYKV